MKLETQVRQDVLNGRQLVCCAYMIHSCTKPHVTGEEDVVWLARSSHLIARRLKTGVSAGWSN